MGDWLALKRQFSPRSTERDDEEDEMDERAHRPAVGFSYLRPNSPEPSLLGTSGGKGVLLDCRGATNHG